MAAGAEGGSGGGMLSGVQDALTGAFSGGKMSNASIADQRKFAGDSITKAFDAFGAMQPNAATGKATSTPSALPNVSSPAPTSAYAGSGYTPPAYQPIDPTGTLYWWLPKGQRS